MTDLDDVFATLQELMLGSESDTARIAAAKILLERLAPKTDDETTRREKEEREAAICEAKILLAEFTAAKLTGLHQPDALAAAGTAATDNADL